MAPLQTTSKRKTVLLRFARTAAATFVAAVAAFLVGPEVTDLIPAEYAVLVGAVLTPLLVALEKALRYGNDPTQPDETPGPPGT